MEGMIVLTSWAHLLYFNLRSMLVTIRHVGKNMRCQWMRQVLSFATEVDW